VKVKNKTKRAQVRKLILHSRTPDDHKHLQTAYRGALHRTFLNVGTCIKHASRELEGSGQYLWSYSSK